LTVTTCPAIVTVDVRGLVDLLGAIATTADARPVALAGTTLTHPQPDEAVQSQPFWAVTDTVGLPPPAATERVAGDTA
jgi:hypothetical protein